MNSIKKLVWFSMQGIKRGILFASLICLIWLAWAYGFTQGVSTINQISQSIELELRPIQINK